LALTRRGKALSALGVLVVIIGGLALGASIYLNSLGVIGSRQPGKAVMVSIPRGSTASDVADLLAERNIIPSAFGFKLYLKIHSVNPTIQAGRYELHEGLNIKDALGELDGRPLGSRYVTVTFPEGSWLVDFARILDRNTHVSGKKFLRLAHSDQVRSKFEPANVHNLEGLLFPSTYQIVSHDSAPTVLRRLVGQLDAQASKIDFSEIDSMGYTTYQAIIVASMVEAEAKLDKDRPKIAEVIYNRLHQGIPLGIDATISYAIGHHVSALTQSDLAIESPFNTRLHTGLPPTPIGAPGLSSLEAAAAPASGDLLYYVVASCQGKHFFTSDYAAFLRAKARYQALSC
jgi:UPF0755 protein